MSLIALFRFVDILESGSIRKSALRLQIGQPQLTRMMAMLEENLLFGSPDTVIEKLKRYEALGVDAFVYYASMGLDLDAQKRSMKL